MNISIIGTGYVGLVSGACFAELGAIVYCIDTNTDKIDKLNKGIIPIYEPGLDDLVQRNIKAGRLRFSTDLTESLNDVEILFIAVGTPPGEDGSADMSHVLSVASEIGKHLEKYLLVVTKSTVPVGSSRLVKGTIEAELKKRGREIEFDVASNPEFLKEGAAIDDFMRPDRVVVGVENEKAKELMTRLYSPMMLNNFRVIFMDIPSAEMTKYAANAMLATRISFMNEIANLCEKVGADVAMVRKGIGSDNRIGNKFLYPGAGLRRVMLPEGCKSPYLDRD
ncbi:MAG: UDP-glucose/GDP-mannose dehydrogenase family protein [Bacteroidales bacterium]|nr:UDP-glucose/GDP-mannose dehydrogenase family protein [Bacteroidales bacterium]